MKPNSNIDIALKVAEQQTERDLNSKISAKMRDGAADDGTPDGLRRAVLARMSTQEYQRAIDDLHAYVDSKDAYPQFRVRSERYVSHCVDLINAIKVKRSFPGVQYLNMAKQKELYDKAMQHFEELRQTLKKIDQIEQEVHLDDVRSTVWVVKAIVYSIFGICIIGFLLELSKGVLPTAMAVIDDTSGRVADWLFHKIGM